MTLSRTTIVVLLTASLSACGGGSDNDTATQIASFDTGFATFDVNGNFEGVDENSFDENAPSGGSFSAANRFRYSTIFGKPVGSDTFIGRVGFGSGGNVGGFVSGSVSYNAFYDAAKVTSDSVLIDGFGEIVLTANSLTDEVTGTSDNFTVNGTISGLDLGGTITFDGTTVPLAGRVGGDFVGGVFVGNTDDALVIGNVQGLAQP